ncbi:hypothetical protein V5O48_000766 [Marasmius crinis-equi]|uniref:RING-type domain-containing protein n=1 Tax=Marasmius crinis-equi TaxID=585013 RepID=A0ABR3G0M8_9AGAR
MSSSYPPQLHLTLPANTTSFKRSFDQFGFDLESPVGTAEAGGSGSGSNGAGASSSRNERNKRPRSASSLSDGDDSLSSGSTFASGSSDTSISESNEPDAVGTSAVTLSPNRPVTSHILGAMPFEPPRLPTPDIQDIEMPDYPLNDDGDEEDDSAERSSASDSPAEDLTVSSEQSYMSSFQRLDDFDSQPFALLSSRAPVPRPPTPPPTLPPLSLPDDQTPLHANVIPFFANPAQSSPTLSDAHSHTGSTTHSDSAISSQGIATQGSLSDTSVGNRSSDPDSVFVHHSTGERHSSLTESLDQLLNHEELSSITLELRRPERANTLSSTRNRPTIAPRIDFGDGPTPQPFMPTSTAFLRRSGSLNNAPSRSESPWRHALNMHLPSREPERSAPYHPPADRDQTSTDFASRNPYTTRNPFTTREAPNLTLNTHHTTPSNPFLYRPPSSVTQHEPHSSPWQLQRQSSSGSLNSDLARWFDRPGPSDAPSRDRSQLERGGPSHRTRNGLAAAGVDDEELEPASRVYSSALDDYESTVPGLRARVMENRRPSVEVEGRRQRRAPPSLTSLLARESAESLDLEPRDLPSESRRRRYIEHGLVDPRETAGRSYEEDERRWRFSWTDSFGDVDDEDDSTPLSESERIYPFSTSSTAIPAPAPTGRRNRPRYSGVLAGSTSLFSENAAEMRRRNDREWIDRLRASSGDYDSWGSPSDDELDIDGPDTRFTFGRTSRPAGVPRTDTSPWSPVLPPLPHQHNPPVMPRAMNDLLSQSERTNREPPSSRRSSRPRPPPSDPRRGSLSWYMNAETSSPGSIERYDLTDTGRESSREHGRNRDPFASRFSEDYLRNFGSSLSRSPSRSEHQASAVRNNRWSTLDEPRRDSPAIFDTQSSSISEIARTITNNDYGLALFDPALDLPSANVDTEMESDAPELYSPPNPPSIPPPDLGNTLFDSGDLSDISPIPRSPELPSFLRLPLTSDEARIPPSRPERSPSPISPIEFASHRPLPPVSSRQFREEQDTNYDSFAPHRSASIDLQGFAPGPYRNTLQRLVERGRLHDSSYPPSIPPLPFESSLPSSRTGSSTLPSYLSARERLSQGPSQTLNQRQPLENRPSFGFQATRTQSNARAAQRGRIPGEGLSTAYPQPRSSNDLHRHLTTHSRIDTALLERELPPSGSSSSELRGLDHALHVLRQDGLTEHRSQQLIERYRRQRRESTEAGLNTGGGHSHPSSSLWGSLEDNRNNRRDPDRTAMEHRHFPRASRNVNLTSGNNTSSAIPDDIGGFVSLPGFPHRRRPASNSPTRRERTTMPDARPLPLGRGRAFASRFSRHRHNHSELEQDFVTLTDLLRRRSGRGGAFSLGDFMRDEDFDSSYETLLSLESALGEVKTRATPDHIIAGLEAAFYKDWATDESDKRCPICLDDYKSLDQVLKLPDCTHWLHKPCLEAAMVERSEYLPRLQGKCWAPTGSSQLDTSYSSTPPKHLHGANDLTTASAK